MMTERAPRWQRILVVIMATIVFIEVTVLLYLWVLSAAAKVRNVWRASQVELLLSAIYDYQFDHIGISPPLIDENPTTVQVIGEGDDCDFSCGNLVSEPLCIDLIPQIGQKYLGLEIYDPLSGTPYNTDYYVNYEADGTLLVGACDPELEKTIEVSSCFFQNLGRCR